MKKKRPFVQRPRFQAADPVRAKKELGQHFLEDASAAERLADALGDLSGQRILEIGPGMGVLTRPLLERKADLKVVELDGESVRYLEAHFPDLQGRIVPADFLHWPLEQAFDGQSFSIVGNFPYNISSQILFKTLENKSLIPSFAGMFQLEVAQRIGSREGNKDYGILSVLTQAYYDVEFLFELGPEVFNPPPKVRSGVIRMFRRAAEPEGVLEKDLRLIVKTAFNQRRKTLRNALSPLGAEHSAVLKLEAEGWSGLRAEQLSVEQFCELARRPAV
ncbi:ribosomal RNA small subunit methyltransferase A [bacterium]|nr:ribosomal RNA small subunit methyltransferase A [bacterium]